MFVLVVGDVLVGVLSPVAQVFFGDHEVVDEDAGEGDQSVGDDFSQLGFVEDDGGELDHLETQAVDFAVQVLVFEQHEGACELVVREVHFVCVGLQPLEVDPLCQLVAADFGPA